jgi:hypothetical protein
LTRKKRKDWLCPHCTQTSSRHWNLKTHIQRIHDGIGQPQTSVLSHLSSSQQPFPNNGNNSSYDGYTGTDRYHQKYSSRNNFYYTGQRYRKVEKESPHPKRRDSIIDDVHENLRKMVEIRDMSNQLKSQSSWEQPAFIGWGGNIPFTRTMTASELVSYYNAQQLNDIQRNNRNIGFRGRVCYNCFSYWVDLVYNNEEEMKSLIRDKPPSHICDPKKIVKAQNGQDLESKKKQADKELINFLVLMFGQSAVALYLKAEEFALSYPDFSLPYRKNNTRIDDNNKQSSLHAEKDQYINIDLDNKEDKQKHWAYRVIKEEEGHEKSIITNKEDLTDFFKTTKATFGAFQVKIDASIRYFFMYLKMK